MKLGGHAWKKLSGALALAIAAAINSPIGQSIQKYINREGIEYTLQDAQAAVAEIEPTLKENRKAVVAVGCQAEYLADEIADLQGKLKVSEGEMRQLANALKDKSRQEFVFAGQSFSRQQVESDLQSRMKLHNRLTSQLNNLLAAKKSAAEPLANGIVDIRSTEQNRQALTAEIEAMNALHDVLQVADKLHDLGTTERGIGQAESLVDKLRRETKIAVRSQNSNLFTGTIPVSKEGAPDDEFFAQFDQGDK